MDNPDYSKAALWQRSVAGFRANLIPGLVLWVVGLGVALAYYKMDSAKGFFDGVIAVKQTHGFLYSFLATGLFGGLIPFLYLWAAGKIKKGAVVSYGAFFFLYWAFRGVEVDAFYRLQSILFGDGLDWSTITTKVLVDQFVIASYGRLRSRRPAMVGKTPDSPGQAFVKRQPGRLFFLKSPDFC